MFTAKVGGRSLYGLLLKFVRVLCRVKREYLELAIVEWFACPQYPDGDPLLVKIDLTRPPPTCCEKFIGLDRIDPTPVMYEYVEGKPHMFVMRIRGLDVLP